MPFQKGHPFYQGGEKAWFKKGHKGNKGSSNWNWKGGKIEKKCLVCKKKIFVWQCQIKKGKGKYCSKKCAGVMTGQRNKIFIKQCWQNPKYRKHMSEVHKGKIAQQASRWKGGKHISTQGYIEIYSPTHPKVINKKRKYVLEHILAMEKLIGRYLKPKEAVHHINGIKIDNRFKNLMLFKNNTEHLKLHKSTKL